MSNYGLDGEQQEAIEWAIKNLEDLRSGCIENQRHIERELNAFRPYSEGNKALFEKLNVRKQKSEERLEKYEKHIASFRSMVNQHD